MNTLLLKLLEINIIISNDAINYNHINNSIHNLCTLNMNNINFSINIFEIVEFIIKGNNKVKKSDYIDFSF